VLHIISAEDTAYHQTEADCLYTAIAVMIYRRKRPMIYKRNALDDIQGLQPLMICQTSLRFGLDKKFSSTINMSRKIFV